MNIFVPLKKQHHLPKAAKNSFYTLCSVFVFCSLLLSGCATKEVSNVYPVQVEKASWIKEHPTGFSEKDLASISMSDTQKEIFLRFTELELGLSKRQLFEIAEYYKAYLNNKSRMEEFLGRSQAYLPYIHEVFSERDMPADLAYLAYLESGFKVKARSHAGAQGIWQFMPRTGESFGLEQDWFGDWRHDPYISTQAAADYLDYLNNLFDDWLLAVSAYNAGEGKIGRALDETGAQTLDELVVRNSQLKGKVKIKDETLEYIPRFIALKKIMMYSQELGLKPNYQDVANLHHEVHSVLVDTNTDLLAVVKSIGMSWEEFHQYNPALKSYVSPSDRLIYVHIPAYKEEEFEYAVKQSHAHEGYHLYTIRKNDTYSKISKNSGIPSYILQQANSSQKLITGKTIVIPKPVGKNLPSKITSTSVESVQIASNAPAKSSNEAVVSSAQATIKASSPKKEVAKSEKSTRTLNVDGTYKVKSGDTLYSISREFNVSLDEVYKMNKGLSAKSLKAGSIIKVQKESNIKEIALNTSQSYKVKSGDTLWSIARKNDTNVDTVMKINNLSSSSKIKAGQTLILP